MDIYMSLIKGEFDRYQSGLKARFASFGYQYSYKNINSVKALEIRFAKEKSNAIITYYENGILDLFLISDEVSIKESFQNINDDDLHTMLETSSQRKSRI